MLFHHMAYDYSCADWHGLCDHFRGVPWEDVFKFSASPAASEFCEYAHIGIDVYFPHHKYWIKPHSSPWFSAACTAAIFLNGIRNMKHGTKSNLFCLNFEKLAYLNLIGYHLFVHKYHALKFKKNLQILTIFRAFFISELIIRVFDELYDY